MVDAHSMPAAAPALSPISTDSTPLFTPNRPIRRYIVSYGSRTIREPNGGSALVRKLRLQGAWLKCAGFDIGAPVTVRVEAGRLVIEAAEPERVPQAEVLASVAQLTEGGLSRRDLGGGLIRRLKQERID